MTSKLVWPPRRLREIVPTDAEWTELERLGRVSLSQHHRNALERNMRLYRRYADGYAAAATPRNVRLRLEKLRAALSRASGTIDSVFGLGDAASWEIQAAAWFVFHERIQPGRLNDLKAEIRRLADYAECAIQHLPPSGTIAKSGDLYIGGLIVSTLWIFHEAGGVGKQSSAAIDFVRGVCRLAGYKAQSTHQSTEAFRSVINRSVSNAKQYTDSQIYGLLLSCGSVQPDQSTKAVQSLIDRLRTVIGCRTSSRYRA